MLRKILHLSFENKIIINQLNNHKKVSQFVVQKKYFSVSNENNEQKIKNEPSISQDDESEDSESIDKIKKLSDLLDNSANFNDVTNREWMTMPYPEDAVKHLDKKQERRKISPEDTSIFLCPGQGALKVGAVKKYLRYPRVKELFQIGNDILGFDILDICLNGPQEKLNRTEYNQVATVMTSLSALEKLWEDSPDMVTSCKVIAGYSVGELTALAYAGSISIEDAIRLASVRGIAMQQASELEPQGMITVIHNKETESMGKICTEAREWAVNLGISEPVCSVSSYLYANAKVIAGHLPAIEFIEKNYKQFRIQRVIKLPVSGAFHTPLMKPAMQSLRRALNNTEIEDPRIVVYSNVTAKPYRSAIEIRQTLPLQMIKQSKWEQILHEIFNRPQDHVFPYSYDLGSGGTMKVILSRLNLAASRFCEPI
ncbi:probable malonyl-CoA-acyl carrier protein transacylase, mitochondrial [Chelonus insularis]|uniref:probable malonyl-CoA-acyl carrier protein transacylase, mitochondrial n=1 Tax=Chelonus insularis TaxID=460826 RepID=UPI00158CAAA2|nr:probable malonyl-CoA-acyl carrier protein transacylase, mitochondrial [Chelonus insularis]